MNPGTCRLNFNDGLHYTSGGCGSRQDWNSVFCESTESFVSNFRAEYESSVDEVLFLNIPKLKRS